MGLAQSACLPDSVWEMPYRFDEGIPEEIEVMGARGLNCFWYSDKIGRRYKVIRAVWHNGLPYFYVRRNELRQDAECPDWGLAGDVCRVTKWK